MVTFLVLFILITIKTLIQLNSCSFRMYYNKYMCLTTGIPQHLKGKKKIYVIFNVDIPAWTLVNCWSRSGKRHHNLHHVKVDVCCQLWDNYYAKLSWTFFDLGFWPMYKSRAIFWTDFRLQKVDLYTGKYGNNHTFITLYLELPVM